MSEHDWCFHTDYCLSCGMSRQVADDSLAMCPDTTNVVAVSHIICERRMRRLLGGAVDRLMVGLSQ